MLFFKNPNISILSLDWTPHGNMYLFIFIYYFIFIFIIGLIICATLPFFFFSFFIPTIPYFKFSMHKHRNTLSLPLSISFVYIYFVSLSSSSLSDLIFETHKHSLSLHLSSSSSFIFALGFYDEFQQDQIYFLLLISKLEDWLSTLDMAALACKRQPKPLFFRRFIGRFSRLLELWLHALYMGPIFYIFAPGLK